MYGLTLGREAAYLQNNRAMVAMARFRVGRPSSKVRSTLVYTTVPFY
jgi:hypothetical protein